MSLVPLDPEDAPPRSPEQKLFFWMIIRALRDWSQVDTFILDDRSQAKASQRDAEELLLRDPERLRLFCDAALVDFNKLQIAVGRGPKYIAEVFRHEDRTRSQQTIGSNHAD